MAVVHEEITSARDAGRLVRLDVDTTALMLETCPLTASEVGQEWLALLNGRPSAFEAAVVRVRSRAPTQRDIPGWQSIRRRIFERDGYACTYCGSTEELECDHVVPFSKGGSSEDDNLTTACRTCNRAKRDRLPEQWLS